ncbi:MAG TPA: LptF/LptG family permease [Planctomycetota bacterium]|nr:LptF/LptG family permease [Planctomycetota bacterium]
MRLLTRIDRYVLRAFATSYAPLVLAFGLLFVIADAFTRLDKFTHSGGPLFRTILGYYGATLPVIFLRFGSFLTLAAGMFAVARLERNNEVMPIKAGGISIHRALLPIAGCAVVLAALSVADAELLIPRLAPAIRRASQFRKQKDVVPGIIRDAAGNTLFAATYRPSTQTLRWVTFRRHDDSPERRETLVSYADRARWIATGEGPGDGYWLLEDGLTRDLGAAREARSQGDAPSIPQERFGSGGDGLRIATSIVPIDVESLREPYSLLSFEDLNAQYARQPYLPGLRVQLHERIASPLAHLILLLIGLPFVLREGGGRATVFVGMLALIVICASFFVITFIFRALGVQGSLPPMIATWGPVVVFGLLGIGLMDRVRT